MGRSKNWLQRSKKSSLLSPSQSHLSFLDTGVTVGGDPQQVDAVWSGPKLDTFLFFSVNIKQSNRL